MGRVALRGHAAVWRLFGRVGLVAIATVLAAGSIARAQAPNWRPEQHAKWHPHVDVVAKPGNARSLGKLDFFAPVLQNDDTLAYLDFRGVVSSDPSREGNFGGGIRHILRNGPFGFDSILGVYGFFDASTSEFDNTFYQGSGGIEWLTNNLEFRVNGYLPANKQYIISTQTANASSIAVSGTTAQKTTTTTITQQIEEPLPGFDVEAGLRLPLLGKRGLWVYGAYFHFARDGVDVSGPRLRLEVPIDNPFGIQGTRLTIGGEIQHDAVRGTQGFAVVRLRIPFAPPPSLPSSSPGATYTNALTGIDRRMTAYIQRDNDIVAPASSVRQPTTSSTSDIKDPTSGQTINVYNVAQGASGDCSASSPCSLATAKAAAGTGDVLVLRDSGGNITETTPLVLGARQQVVGGGSSGTADVTLSSGDQLALSGLGGRPTLNNSSGGGDFGSNSVIQMGTSSTVAGVALTGGDAGVKISSANNATLSDVNISNTNGSGTGLGVYASGSDNLTLTNVNVSSISGGNPGGIRVDGPSNGVTITGGSVTSISSTTSGAYGMIFNPSVDNVSINGTTINGVTGGTSQYGIAYGGSSFSISNSTIKNVGGVGLRFISGATTASVNTTTFDTVGTALDLNGQTFTTLSGTGNTATGYGTLCVPSGGSGGSGVTFTSPPQTCN